MGGIGTFKLGAQFPDLFARAQPTVGDEPNTDVLASIRNLPVLMWNTSADELVNATEFTQTADKLQNLGYRYELDIYLPCASTLVLPALFPITSSSPSTTGSRRPRRSSALRRSTATRRT